MPPLPDLSKEEKIPGESRGSDPEAGFSETSEFSDRRLFFTLALRK